MHGKAKMRKYAKQDFTTFKNKYFKLKTVATLKVLTGGRRHTCRPFTSEIEELNSVLPGNNSRLRSKGGLITELWNLMSGIG